MLVGSTTVTAAHLISDTYMSRTLLSPEAIPLPRDESLLEDNARKLNADDDSLNKCDPSTFDFVFTQRSYGYVTSFYGLDHTATLGNSMALDEGHLMVGSSGFDVNRGMVHYFKSLGKKYYLHSTIKPSLQMSSFFGSSVAVHGNTMLVGANGFDLYDGAVFAYKYQKQEDDWSNSATIYSPFGSLNARFNSWGLLNSSAPFEKSFGHRICLFNKFAIISTGGNSAFIYEEQPDLQWTINTRLKPLTNDEKFGHSCAINDEFAAVGSPNYGEHTHLYCALFQLHDAPLVLMVSSRCEVTTCIRSPSRSKLRTRVYL